MAKKSYTAKQLQAAFAVGHMTIYNWRQGTATRDPLPCETDEESGRVTFPAASTKAWAKKYGLEFVEPTDSGEASKPGPKATAKKATPVKKSVKAKFAKVTKQVEKQQRKIDPNTTAAIKEAAQKAIGVTKSQVKRVAAQKKPKLTVVPGPVPPLAAGAQA